MAEYDGKKCVVDCKRCENGYVLGRANSQVYNFEDEGIILVESTCNCGTEHDNFIDEQMMRFLKRQGVEVIDRENPPALLVRRWMELHPEEWVPVAQYELSERHERAVTALHWELEGVVTPQDILDVDIENRLPRNWI